MPVYYSAHIKAAHISIFFHIIGKMRQRLLQLCIRHIGLHFQHMCKVLRGTAQQNFLSFYASCFPCGKAGCQLLSHNMRIIQYFFAHNIQAHQGNKQEEGEDAYAV